jgi:hypothetical protein
MSIWHGHRNSSKRSPDGAKRNPGFPLRSLYPATMAAHAGEANRILGTASAFSARGFRQTPPTFSVGVSQIVQLERLSCGRIPHRFESSTNWGLRREEDFRAIWDAMPTDTIAAL